MKMKKVSLFKIVMWDVLITGGFTAVASIINLKLGKMIYHYLQHDEPEDIGQKVDVSNLNEKQIDAYNRLVPKVIKFLVEYTLKTLTIIGIYIYKH